MCCSPYKSPRHYVDILVVSQSIVPCTINHHRSVWCRPVQCRRPLGTHDQGRSAIPHFWLGSHKTHTRTHTHTDKRSDCLMRQTFFFLLKGFFSLISILQQFCALTIVFKHRHQNVKNSSSAIKAV